jgi:hypothetical protein
MNTIQPYNPHVKTITGPGTYPDYYLKRDSYRTHLNPRVIGIGIAAFISAPIVLCGIVVAWGWFFALILPVVAFLSIYSGEPWNLRIRHKEKMIYHYRRRDDGYYYEDQGIPSKHEDNPIWQMLLTDIFDEHKMLGDKFKMSEWRDRINDLEVELDRQKQEDIERANKIERADYAKLARETREIMNNALEA